LIARKSQPIVIAVALIAPINGAFSHASQELSYQTSRIEMNAALSPVERHLLAEHTAAAQASRAT
jgi:hypothetical protein